MKKMSMLMICILLSSLGHAAGGGEVGNGGDMDAQEFVRTARSVLDYLKQNEANIDVVALKTAVDSTIVLSSAKILMLDGIQKDAINYPGSHEIIFNRKRWFLFEESQREQLVLHEYLGIMQTDDSDYHLSTSLLAQLRFGRTSAYNSGINHSPGALQTTIEGVVAQQMYEQLQVPVHVISGIDGEQLTKEGDRILCAVMSGRTEYKCYLTVDEKGVN